MELVMLFAWLSLVRAVCAFLSQTQTKTGDLGIAEYENFEQAKSFF